LIENTIEVIMWRVNITCSGEAWKLYGADFKAMTDKYQGELIASKKMPDETRLMAYKIEDVSDAEAFQADCANFTGFTSDFESL
jgi:hypothetical protein